MNSWLKRGMIGIALIAGLAGAAVLAGEQMGRNRAARTVSLAVQPVALSSDAAAVDRGRYLFNSRGCADCHGAQGGGHTLVDDGKGTRLAGPNITQGNPALAAYKPEDWVRSIRHGVAPGGRVLRLMPSEDYNRLTDDDRAAVVAYVRQFPPLEGNPHGIIELPLIARVMYGFGAIPEAVEKIDHRLPPSPPLAEGPTALYGSYVAQMCLGCHGAKLEGGKILGAPPDWPAAARLAPGTDSVMPRYADKAAFLSMLKSGKRADGSAIAVMPFEALAKLSENDATALHAYLTSLAPR